MLRVAMHADFDSVQNNDARGIFTQLHGTPSSKSTTRWSDVSGDSARRLAAEAASHTRGNVRAVETGPASPTPESLRAEKARLSSSLAWLLRFWP